MVEMTEANHALKRASKHSLILFDELGRGTATYDGMALAQAIIEYIYHHVQAKTMFATHYHELTSLSKELTNLVNVHVATLEKDGEVTFLHQIAEGPADKSYGIHVAKIAGLPEELLERADVILEELETNASEPPLSPTTEDNQKEKPATDTSVGEQLSLFEEPSYDKIIKTLKETDMMTLTPMEAMNLLFTLKQEL